MTPRQLLHRFVEALEARIALVERRRERILREMRRRDELAEDGFPDQGGYLVLEVRLVEVRRSLRELRRLRRAA